MKTCLFWLSHHNCLWGVPFSHQMHVMHPIMSHELYLAVWTMRHITRGWVSMHWLYREMTYVTPTSMTSLQRITLEALSQLGDQYNSTTLCTWVAFSKLEWWIKHTSNWSNGGISGINGSDTCIVWNEWSYSIRMKCTHFILCMKSNILLETFWSYYL